jgi:glycosyltransferase involved in cell wall biosynthesis
VRNVKPRLLFLSNLFPTAAEPYRGLDNATLLHALAEDFEIRVLSPRPVLPWARATFTPRPQDVPLSPHWVPSAYLPKIGSPVNHLLMAASLRNDLEAALHSFNPEVILTSWIYPDSLAALHLIHGRLPLVAIAQGSDVHHYLEIPSRRRAILRYLPHASAVVTRSGELSRLLANAGFPAEKLHAIYNGVDLDLFHPRDQAAARRELFLPEGVPVILFVGNFFKVKNPQNLILAMAELKTPDSLLVMAGGGPLEEPCRELAAKFNLENRVIFAGRKTPGEIAHLMNAADVLALPSQNEGVPNVILEAFASGLPIVASQVGGIPEVLNQDFLGGAVPTGDIGALAAALDRRLSSPRETARIRDHAGQFSWSAAAAKYRNLLLPA